MGESYCRQCGNEMGTAACDACAQRCEHCQTQLALAVNPRFWAYARVHGRTPDAMLEHDEERWPGGKMAGFTLWIGERWQEWAVLASHPRANDSYAILGEADHVAFDAYLSELGENSNLAQVPE